MSKILSAVQGLKPSEIYCDGEKADYSTLVNDLNEQAEYVYNNSIRIWNTNSSHIEAEVKKTSHIDYKQKFLRNIVNTTVPKIPNGLAGNYREIIEFKILSESESWIRSKNPHKKKFSFNHNVDLSATNDQLSSIQVGNNTVLLNLRCMSKKYTILIPLPYYLLKRKVTKYSKPRVRLQNNSDFVFDFTIEEDANYRKKNLRAGIDLGKVEPYTAVVVSGNNKIMAQFTASKGLKSLWNKKNRLSTLINEAYLKKSRLEDLGIDTAVLSREITRLKNKKTRLHSSISKLQAIELSKKLEAFPVSEVNVENLKWLSGSKGEKNKGGKWSYSKQQDDLKHSLARKGIRQKIVSPKNSSQKCSKCGCFVKHNSKKRLILCACCKLELDRDVNAALNLATLKHLEKKEALDRLCGSIEAGCTAIEPSVDESQLQVKYVRAQQVQCT